MDSENSNGNELSATKCDSEDCQETSNRLKRKSGELDDDKNDNLPSELKKLFGPLHCGLCGVTANSTLSSYTHYKGKVHRKKVDKYLKEHNLSVPTKKSKTDFTPTRCDLCNVDLTSEIQSLQHYSGKSHKKKALNPGAPKVTTDFSAPPDPTGRFGIGVGFLKGESDEPTDFSSEQSTGDVEKNNVHFCSVCSVFTTSAEALYAHREGAKHKKKASFAQTVDNDFLSKFRTPSNNYYCSFCDMISNSGEQFMIHVQSKKHSKLASKC